MLYEHVRRLYDEELWSNVRQLGPLALAIANTAERKSRDGTAAFGVSPAVDSANILTGGQRINVLLMLGEAYLRSKEYRRAEALYLRMLSIKRDLVRSRSHDEDGQLLSDGDVRLRLARCFLASGDEESAAETLLAVEPGQRTPAMNMALAEMYHRAGRTGLAVMSYKDVLRQCPLSLEAARCLLQLGVKVDDVRGLMSEAATAAGPWLDLWLTATAAMEERDYREANAGFRKLENSFVGNEVSIVTNIGLNQYYEENIEGACHELSRAHSIDPCNVRGMDVLAAIYFKNRQCGHLEDLAVKLSSVSDDAAESWVVNGYHSYLNKKASRALHCAHKACLTNPRSVEALLLKGNVLLELKKIQDARSHFTKATMVEPNRFEAHKGLIDCLLAQGHLRDAINMAAATCKMLGKGPRTLTLFATLLAKNKQMDRAKSALTEALHLDPYYLRAIYKLVEIYEQENKFDIAITVLQTLLDVKPTSRLFQRMGDMLLRKDDEPEALDCYTKALNLNPRNVKAQEAIQKIEQGQDGQHLVGGAGDHASVAVAASSYMDEYNSDEDGGEGIAGDSTVATPSMAASALMEGSEEDW